MPYALSRWDGCRRRGEHDGERGQILPPVDHEFWQCRLAPGRAGHKQIVKALREHPRNLGALRVVFGIRSQDSREGWRLDKCLTRLKAKGKVMYDHMLDVWIAL